MEAGRRREREKPAGKRSIDGAIIMWGVQACAHGKDGDEQDGGGNGGVQRP